MKKRNARPVNFILGIIILFFLISQTTWAQSNCTTTAISIKFSPPDFQKRIQYPDLLSFTCRNDASIVYYFTSDKTPTGSLDSLHITKIDDSGNVIWSKTIDETFPGYAFLWSSGIELSDSSIILYGQGGHYDDNSAPNLAFSLLKLNADGSFAWQKEFSSAVLGFDFAVKIFSGDQNDFFLYGPSMLFHFDLNGTILWQKEIQPNNTRFQFIQNREGLVVNHKVITATNFTWLDNNLYLELGVVFSTVDYETGNLNNAICYRLNDPNPDFDTLTLGDISFGSSTSGKLLYTTSVFSENGIFESYILSVDQSLKTSQTATDIIFDPPLFKPGPAVYSANCATSPSGNLSCIFDNPFNRNINYFSLIDADQNIIVQRKISLSDPVYMNSLYQMTNGLMKSVYVSPLDAPASYMYYTQTSPDFISSACSGEDTAFLKKRMVPITSFPWSFSYKDIDLTPGLDIMKTELPFSMPGTVVCEQSSTCDSIKIAGPDTVCNNAGLTSYLIYRNADCLSKADWLIDSSAIKSFTILSDTSISVSFSRSGSVWLFASLSGCGKKDSIYIHSISDDRPLNLGADTSICIGKTMKLFAGIYQKYNWQDGSQDSIYIVSQPGLYKVDVTDFCSYAYADSIRVTYIDCVNSIHFPNAFTPNSDGVNDLFRPVVHGNIFSYELSVYDVWGALVFQTRNPVAGWDGRFKGQQQDTGGFVWFCKYQFTGQQSQLLKGSLILIR